MISDPPRPPNYGLVPETLKPCCGNCAPSSPRQRSTARKCATFGWIDTSSPINSQQRMKSSHQRRRSSTGDQQ